MSELSLKILVCGDRDWTNVQRIREILATYSTDITIIEGEARGADSIARDISTELGFTVVKCPADWSKYGRSAGPIRNIQMLDMKPDIVLAFHDDLERSKGTRHTVTEAMRRGIHVIVYTSQSE